jgi:tRNA pseudouridine38-40 synthase
MRYFIEVAYNGQGYAGFQVQDNAITIQHEIEKALALVAREQIGLSGSSRTDAGVHAKQNFFHFDSGFPFTDKHIYNLNALLPASIAVNSIRRMPEKAHCRFDAIGRLYKYHLSSKKNPFYHETAWFYPYPLNLDVLNETANLLLGKHNFTSFSKRNTQVKSMICEITKSEWQLAGDRLIYTVRGNRFLRGMVRGLVGTMLLVGRGKKTVQDFQQIMLALDSTKADFTSPAHGLCLEQVIFREGYFGEMTEGR